MPLANGSALVITIFYALAYRFHVNLLASLKDVSSSHEVLDLNTHKLVFTLFKYLVLSIWPNTEGVAVLVCAS